MEIKIEPLKSPSKKGKDNTPGLRLAKRSSVKEEPNPPEKRSSSTNINRIKNLKNELLGEIRNEGSRKSSINTISQDHGTSSPEVSLEAKSKQQDFLVIRPPSSDSTSKKPDFKIEELNLLKLANT